MCTVFEGFSLGRLCFAVGKWERTREAPTRGTNDSKPHGPKYKPRKTTAKRPRILKTRATKPQPQQPASTLQSFKKARSRPVRSDSLGGRARDRAVKVQRPSRACEGTASRCHCNGQGAQVMVVQFFRQFAVLLQHLLRRARRLTKKEEKTSKG